MATLIRLGAYKRDYLQAHIGDTKKNIPYATAIIRNTRMIQIRNHHFWRPKPLLFSNWDLCTLLYRTGTEATRGAVGVVSWKQQERVKPGVTQGYSKVCQTVKLLPLAALTLEQLHVTLDSIHYLMWLENRKMVWQMKMKLMKTNHRTGWCFAGCLVLPLLRTAVGILSWKQQETRCYPGYSKVCRTAKILPLAALTLEHLCVTLDSIHYLMWLEHRKKVWPMKMKLMKTNHQTGWCFAGCLVLPLLRTPVGVVSWKQQERVKPGVTQGYSEVCQTVKILPLAAFTLEHLCVTLDSIHYCYHYILRNGVWRNISRRLE